MYQDGVDDWSLDRRPTTRIKMDGASHQFSKPAHETPKVRSENTLQLRVLSWIPT